MSFHLVLPNHEVLADFVLTEEIYFLQFVVGFLVLKPFLTSQELCLLIMIESDTLTTDCHVLLLIPFCIGNYLIVIGVRDSVQVEEIFHHFRKGVIESEYLLRLKISFHFAFAFLDDRLGLFGKLFNFHLVVDLHLLLLEVVSRFGKQ